MSTGYKKPCPHSNDECPYCGCGYLEKRWDSSAVFLSQLKIKNPKYRVYTKEWCSFKS
jgi:hypothetical protein